MTSSFRGSPSGPVRVRVPATSANLGPGFDALGLALSLHDVVEARVDGAGLSIEVTGEGAGAAEAGEGHLVVRAMRETFGLLGGQPPGIALRCANRIPHGRGLGSSAAAIVSGILAARALADHGAVRLPDDAVLRLAAGMEGHPDNVAACLAGGLTIAWTAAGQARMIRLSPVPDVVPVAFVAPAPLATEAARRVLPESVPHADAAANAGRSALLVAALTGDPGALLDATQDFLHQPYRAGVMPATADLVRRLREAGVPAVVSGAGPSVLAFMVRQPSADGAAPHSLEVLGSSARETGTRWGISVLDVDRQGASIQSMTPGAFPAGGTP
jgi:homoserine kinase